MSIEGRARSGNFVRHFRPVEECPFLSFDEQITRMRDFVYAPFPEPVSDAVISDKRVRELVPILEARTVDPLWMEPVRLDEVQRLMWWRYWRGVESGKIQRPLPKSRRPITLAQINHDENNLADHTSRRDIFRSYG